MFNQFKGISPLIKLEGHDPDTFEREPDSIKILEVPEAKAISENVILCLLHSYCPTIALIITVSQLNLNLFTPSPIMTHCHNVSEVREP